MPSMLFRRRSPAAGAPDPAPAEPRERLAAVLAELRSTDLHAGRWVTDVLAGGFRTTFRGAGVEFSDVREYVEGDDPRSVDWNVTARVGRPMVKRYVEERERTVVFALDGSVGMEAGLGAWSLRQAAARFCALLGLAAIQNHDRIGLLLAGARLDRLWLPNKGGGHVLRLLRQVVERPACAGPADVDVLLATAAARLRRRVVLFVLSDFAGEQPYRSLLPCARRHDVVLVRLVPREHEAPPPCLLELRDPHDGRRVAVDFAHAPTAAAWRAAAERQRQWRDEQFGRAGVDVVDVHLPQEPDVAAVVAPLQAFFHRRALREVKR